MKYVAIDMHFIRDVINKTFLNISHVRGLDQLADLLTKLLNRQHHVLLRNYISNANETPILREHVMETSHSPSMLIFQIKKISQINLIYL